MADTPLKDRKRRARQHQSSYRIRALIRICGDDWPRCARCGIADLRVLQINHREGDGKSDYGRGENGGIGISAVRFYKAIARGQRKTDDLEVLCANCNILYEFHIGRRRSRFTEEYVRRWVQPKH